MKQLTQVILILFFVFPFISQASNYKIGQTLYVVANDGLVLRSKPSTYGDKLMTLQHGEKVVIKELTDQKANIFGFDGNWVKIQTGSGKTGYVFDAFTSTLPIAKPMYEVFDTKPEGSFDFGGYLPDLLKQYLMNHFTDTGCVFEYNNREDNDSAHRMKITKFGEGHVMIEHQYWEGNSTEVTLVNVRFSEVYYFVHQLFRDTDEEFFKLSEEKLRSAQNGYDCIGELNDNGCGVWLVGQGDNVFVLTFSFPCC